MVDGYRSKQVNILSGVPKGSVLSWLLFLLYISELVSILENKLIGFTDESTLLSVVTSPGVRVTVAESSNRYLGKVSEWCDLCIIKLYSSKAKTMIVSRSRTMHPQSPALTISGTVEGVDDLVILGVTFDRSQCRAHDILRQFFWRFGVLFCSVVLRCRYTPKTT